MLLTTCLDVVILLGVVGLATGGSVLFKALQGRVQTCGDALDERHPTVRKLGEIIAADPRLQARSISVVRRAPAAVFTYGWLRPRLFVDACFVRDNDAQILRAALLHELAHARELDPLRIFVARICLMLNPLGRLLAPEFERWRDAREGVCDAEAVRLGGDPLSLAEGILSAARFRCAGTAACGMSMLCGHDAAMLRLRVALLMDGPLVPRRTLGRLALTTTLLAVVVVPHLADPGALERFHFAVEILLFGVPA
jgi:beta-lactamase regulating signal transducer with metallopeptidase domain